jgi:tricorn protease
MLLRRAIVALLVISATAAAQAPTAGTQGFYRFPSIRGQTIVFAAEGDLWSVGLNGGLAHRLTSHAAEETDPVISPDGRTLAFTARYEGPAALYTMPISGGAPTRWTYDGDAAVATNWTPDGKLVYRTLQYTSIPKAALVQLNLADGTRSQVPLAGASEAAYDASGRTVYFARPAFHNNVTKRYTGGTARDVWKFTTGTPEAIELTGDYNGESHSPMWWNNRVYFVSDRDGTMNVWSMAEDGKDKRQVTRHNGWDVRDPALADGKIVYQHAADLWLLDIASGQTKQLPITLASDLDQLRENWVSDPMTYLSSAHLSNDGDRVALTARGRLFVAPVKTGRFVRASRKDSVRFRDAVFAPDGKSLIALSDETGELEFVRVPASGVGNDEALTKNGNILRYQGNPSPDGKWLAWDDNNRDLWVMNLATKETRKASENREGIGGFRWSPDSRWLAFEMSALNSFRQIKIFSVESGRSVDLTSDRSNSWSPAWDAKGEFIYYLSDRNLRTLVGAPWGNRRPEPYFDKEVEIYQVALRPGLRSPFAPDDELKKPAAPAGRPDTTVKPVVIDVEGLQQRIRRVPVPSGNFNALKVNAEALFYTARGSGADAKTDLTALKLTNEKPEPVVVLDDVRNFDYVMSGNGKKILVRKANILHVVDAKAAKVANANDSRVDLAGWTFDIDTRDDFRQIFVDAWRLERDWFYDPSLHGVDYKATLNKYLALVPRITTRNELSDLIGWAVGELSALHTSVGGGDLRRGEDNIAVASLGAKMFRDPAKGGYRIDYIYRTDPDYPAERSPLADPDLNVKAGDVITAVNGVKTLAVRDIGELLRNQVGKQVLVTLGDGANSRDIVVEPIGNEQNLRYTDWEYTRRLETEKKGDNAIGYLHLRAMGGNDINQFYRELTPIFNKQGVILDMRQNRGGNIDSWVLEMLMRKPWMYWKDRVGEPYWNMQGAVRGHMVMLVDHETASDGEAVADGFRRLGLGVVIGTRTWGGEIWLSGVNTLSDGGVARAPMSGVYGPEGKWLIEQEGLHPDIVVDNLPHATFNGQDAQLDAAIAYLKKKIAEDPRKIPPPPPYPKKAVKILP